MEIIGYFLAIAIGVSLGLIGGGGIHPRGAGIGLPVWDG